jgi:50S ribosomal protein L16 3-hydroxylase
MRSTSPLPLLGARTPASFMREFWQKEALLIRQALPGFKGFFDRAQLFALAARDDVETRIVVRHGARWEFEQGPFQPKRLKALPARGWTLLVQGVNLVDARADRLLRRFSFIPYARLDDLMVSYAAPGGGVGPHFDSYDVFLLQGSGRRRWRYGRQDNLALKPDLPIKILRSFAPQFQALLAPGDMLYLPPAFAHDGVALDACTTYSIGFRTASHDELAHAYLDFLHDELAIEGRYADPDLRPTGAPARIGPTMQRRMGAALRGIAWDARRVARFIGCYLSEPKAHVVFDPPEKPLSLRAFATLVGKRGVALDRRAQLLYDAQMFYLNGETIEPPASARALLSAFADQRALSARESAGTPVELLRLLYDWYQHGFLDIAG